MTPFIKLNNSRETLDLLKDRNAYVLLTQIALRARRKTGTEMCNGVSVPLEVNQAFIGDYTSIGLTEKEYRNAKNRLLKSKLITVKGANRGTIATLINKDVFDINSQAGADKGRTRGD